jgi:glycosyltransferase involved in cell wall biosynthesis
MQLTIYINIFGKHFVKFMRERSSMYTIKKTQFDTKITFYIVTPSLNSLAYIDNAITGVASQAGAFSIRYHVQDGGSTDGTRQRLEEWRRFFTTPNPLVRCRHLEFTWNSEADSGMYQAVNRGFAFLDVPDNGIMAWANADDQYLPSAFSTVAKAFNEESSVEWLGGGMLGSERGALTPADAILPHPSALIRAGYCDERHRPYLDQAPMFWRGSLWKKAGPLDDRLRYAGDYELWPRFAQHADFVRLPVPVCVYASHSGQLSRQRNAHGRTLYEEERDRVRLRPDRQQIIPNFWRTCLCPAKGPVLAVRGSMYRLENKAVIPRLGELWKFFRYRLRVCRSQLGARLRKIAHQ